MVFASFAGGPRDIGIKGTSANALVRAELNARRLDSVRRCHACPLLGERRPDPSDKGTDAADRTSVFHLPPERTIIMAGQLEM